jgi:hypothetical protein
LGLLKPEAEGKVAPVAEAAPKPNAAAARR